MENKQTSIDWLFENLKSHFEHDGDLLESVEFSFQHAKAMYYQEILKAFNEGGKRVEEMVIKIANEQINNINK